MIWTKKASLFSLPTFELFLYLIKITLQNYLRVTSLEQLSVAEFSGE